MAIKLNPFSTANEASPADVLAKRVRGFQSSFARRHREQLSDLVRYGEKPVRLFVSCADARIIPDALTGSKPGENFSVRVVGNIVPPYDLNNPNISVGSAVEYAVKVLEVKEIIVCGHSHCGACEALITGHRLDLSLTHRWLEYGLPVLRAIESQLMASGHELGQLLNNSGTRNEILRATERALVVQQLQNLLSYPFVAERIREGTLHLHGWYYEIESGQVEQYDDESLSFLPVAQAAKAAAERQAAKGAAPGESVSLTGASERTGHNSLHGDLPRPSK